jgi:gliding motility-associated-like protein
VPNIQANAGVDIEQCANINLNLNATNPSKGTGIWSQANGANLDIINPSLNTTALSGFTAGQNYNLIWTLSNGACKNYTKDTVAIKLKGLSFAPTAPDTLKACGDNTTVLLGNNPPSGANGFWTQSAVQAQIGIVITNPVSNITNVTGLISGNTYFFKWNFVGQDCNDTLSKQVAVSYQNLEKANGGNDTLICSGTNSIQLNAAQGVLGIGTWSTSDTSIIIKSPNLPKSEIVVPKSGAYTLVWSLQNANCGVFSKDTVLINNYPTPKAKEDTIHMALGGVGKTNVLNNDTYLNNVVTSIVQTPLNGVAKLLGNNEISFDAYSNFAGADKLRYKICSELCPNLCGEADVILDVEGIDECRIPSLMTPNDDGTNDYFIIPCLYKSNLKNNSLVIFNQWGSEVFKAAPYNNDWQGTFQNEKLPSGTYFFILDYGDGNKAKTGFIVIER